VVGGAVDRLAVLLASLPSLRATARRTSAARATTPRRTSAAARITYQRRHHGSLVGGRLGGVIPNPAAAAAVARAVAGLPGVLVAAVGSKAVVGVGPGMAVPILEVVVPSHED
jgi:hypothetical protein